MICADIGPDNKLVPIIGKTWYCLSLTSSVETRLKVLLLKLAPTVIELMALPGLPIDPNPGPLFPAAVTTTIPFFIA